MKRIRIIGLVNGMSTPFDGKYLMEYDPRRGGFDPDGNAMLAHIVCTDDPSKALQFPSAFEAMEKWKEPSGRTRADGKRDRPLTAFTVEVV
jgi:hypothetical protein